MDAVKPSMAAEAKTKALSLFDEFKKFAFKGNVIDMAVGVIIGAAFAKIIDSLVKHIIMPVVGLILPSEQGYKSLAWTIGEKSVPYGEFIAEVVNFLLVALVLYIFIVKFLGFLLRTKKAEAAAPPPQTKDQELLTEIRDLMKQRPA